MKRFLCVWLPLLACTALIGLLNAPGSVLLAQATTAQGWSVLGRPRAQLHSLTSDYPPALRLLATLSPTPESGLRIHGTVRLAYAAGPGVPSVQIFLGVANPSGGQVVAQTDAQGDYDQGAYTPLSNPENITVHAELPGYNLEPQQYNWEKDRITGMEDRALDFVASPLATTCSTPAPVPNRLFLPTIPYQTADSTILFDIGVALFERTQGLITVVGPAGMVSRKGTLSLSDRVSIEVPLLPDTTNYFTVYGQFDYGPGCTYITSTQFDEYGHGPLRTVQQDGIPTPTAKRP